MITFLYNDTVYWTRKDAETNGGNNDTIKQVWLTPLHYVVDDYYDFRGLKEPDAGQALAFLMSEMGELADRYAMQTAGWVRNNPENKSDDVQSEGGDVLMMLVKFLQRFNADPISEMINKFRRKGFSD